MVYFSCISVGYKFKDFPANHVCCTCTIILVWGMFHVWKRFMFGKEFVFYLNSFAIAYKYFLIFFSLQHWVQAYRHGIKFPFYLLLIPAWYKELWWHVQDAGLSCTIQQRESVLFSSLAFLTYNFLRANSEEDLNVKTTTGIVSLWG